ncbi:hypothetical protein TARUN_2343 [Trichoderma arundinaceum]|uniref:Chromo domain-containing protein n=1 Tax=Trichoderma arundinaceum TaxID=490622 RepID=A0A395NUZ2_TRIAR|nr:hypothetical protein TARUN_2343 [Trichoderma arundinaceum]
MASRQNEESFEDDISLTSTDDEIGEEELFVSKILAEREIEGELLCLTQWRDLPLAEATWEPKDNLNDALIAQWEQTKADQRNGLVPKFRLQEWKEACLQKYDAKLARHSRRNAVRARRGYPQTNFSLLLDHQYLDLYSNDEGEIDRLEASPTEENLVPSQSHDSISPSTNQLEKGTSELSTESSVDPPQTAVQERLLETPDARTSNDLSKKISLNHVAQSRPTLEDVRTTRRNSIKGLILSSESSRESHKRAAPHRTSTTGSAGYTNVFAGGRTRRGRGTLSEAASNPETHPKFLNSHLQRKIELQRRDKEGIKPPVHRPPALISLDRNRLQNTPSEQLVVEKAKDNTQVSEKSKPNTKIIFLSEDEPMEMDPKDSLFVPEQPPSPVPVSSDAETSELGSHVCEEQPQKRTVIKTVQLGLDKSYTVTLSFSSIPSGTSLQWAAQFRSDERLIFTHTCTAQDFSSQTSAEGGLSIVRLCEGTVLSYTENASLTNLVNNLKLGSFGLLCRNDRYSVLLFCARPNSQITKEPENASLEYTIFEPVNSLGPLMLAPIPRLRILNVGGTSSAFCSRPLDQIFGRKYEQLLPVEAKTAEKHNFFLAFPSRAGEEATLLSQWLRNCCGNNNIRTSHFAGHWSSFSKLPHGVVIIHEDGLWFIRSFPNMDQLLHTRRTQFKFWMFSRALLPLRPLDTRDLSASPLGDIRLQNIFDFGIIFLMTPSFFVSEPERAYSFLKWFWNRYIKSDDPNQSGKLVLCARVDEWAYSLYQEKIVLRHKYPKTTSEEELDAEGMSDKAMECRNKTFRFLHRLVEDSNNGRTSDIVLAPESIDGNDEQSLVNWFGYRSILHADQFRRYTIVGSSRQTEVRLSRILHTPNYKKSVRTDPDEPQSDPEPRSATPSSGPQSWREDESFSIHSVLSDLVKAPREWSPVKLYWYPVASSARDVAPRLGDKSSKYSTYESWFNYFWRYFETGNKVKPHSGKLNAGLFYTYDGHQASSCAPTNAQRSPWVAAFRPANPNIRPWKTLELFIWDIRYSESINEGKSLYYSDLREAQQRLIELVQERTRGILPLEKIWVGAFGAKAGGTTVLDVTIRWLDSMLGKAKDWIPAPAGDIPRRGWSLLTLGRLTGEQESNSVVTDVDASNVDSQSEDDISPQKIIFHPPRGNGQRQFTRCRNRLYEWAQNCDPNSEGRKFEYVFRPTMDWYGEQCEEGRGFEHIRVLSWCDIFQAYSIEESLKNRLQS